MARRGEDKPRPTFAGFDKPESNWFRMPNSWTDITARINSIAELKVVEYILRHTWGYQEYGEKKHITIDEFVKGRRRHDSSRMDHGTGLSERAVYDGLRLAREDGLIEEAIDDSDRGRVKKSYSLRMRTADEREISNTSDLQDLQPGVQSLHPGLQKLQGRGAKTAARSEKYTQERQENNFEIRKIAHDLNEFERIGTRGADGLLDQAEIPSIGSHGSAEDEPRESIENPAIPGEAKLGDLIRARQEQAGEFPRRRGRPPGTGDEREIVTAYMRDWAVVELGDEAPLSSSVTRAITILKTADIPVGRWSDLLYQARAITKEHSGQITKKPAIPGRSGAAKNRMPYFLAVLEDLAGLRKDPISADHIKP